MIPRYENNFEIRYNQKNLIRSRCGHRKFYSLNEAIYVAKKDFLEKYQISGIPENWNGELCKVSGNNSICILKIKTLLDSESVPKFYTKYYSLTFDMTDNPTKYCKYYWCKETNMKMWRYIYPIYFSFSFIIGVSSFTEEDYIRVKNKIKIFMENVCE